MSPLQDPEGIATDAFLYNWDFQDQYAFPPLPLIRKVLNKLQASRNARLILATEGVVSGPVAGVDRATPKPSVVKGPPEATTHPQVPPQSPRVETVWQYLRYSGFSSRVAQFLAHGKQPSTSLNYQHNWKR